MYWNPTTSSLVVFSALRPGGEKTTGPFPNDIFGCKPGSMIRWILPPLKDCSRLALPTPKVMEAWKMLVFGGLDPPMRTKKNLTKWKLVKPSCKKKNITQKTCIFNNASWNPNSHPPQQKTRVIVVSLFFENP